MNTGEVLTSGYGVEQRLSLEKNSVGLKIFTSSAKSSRTLDKDPLLTVISTNLRTSSDEAWMRSRASEDPENGNKHTVDASYLLLEGDSHPLRQLVG